MDGCHAPRTLFRKIWDRHRIADQAGGRTLLYIDRQFMGDDLLPDVFDALTAKGMVMRHPDLAFATPDHYVPTSRQDLGVIEDVAQRRMVETLFGNAAAAGFTLFGLDDPRQGIVHVVGPEQGLSRPGMTIVCADSHTATHGALGALAFGIGSAETSHVLATQTLWQKQPRSMRIRLDGTLPECTTAKDLILALIAHIGASGATGYAVEFAGPTIRMLGMEGRMTLCNMVIEAGARTGLIAPDEVTFDYLAGRTYTPQGRNWDAALAFWRTLPSDPDAVFDREIVLDVTALQPMVTWGTSPEDAAPVDGYVPDPATAPDVARRSRWQAALDYMGLHPGQPLLNLPIDQVFIGSCTNGRIEDLRAASRVLRGRHATVPVIVVPGSGMVKRQAELEGLHRIFRDAGCEWREPGCSMCIAVNGDMVPPGARCASTTNRNFVGRQGRGARTHLMSPPMAAAAAIAGAIADVRRFAPGI